MKTNAILFLINFIFNVIAFLEIKNLKFRIDIIQKFTLENSAYIDNQKYVENIIKNKKLSEINNEQN